MSVWTASAIALPLLSLMAMAALRSISRSIFDASDLALLDFAPADAAKGKIAIVLGGSLAGMFVAAVLARFFHRVIIIERNAQPNDAVNRGVPQSTQSHILAALSGQTAERLLPGFTKVYVANGAVLGGDFGGNLRWFRHGVWMMRQPHTLPMLASSRPVLDKTVRSILLSTYRNIEWRPGLRALQLTTDASQRIVGVQVADRAEQTTTTWEADLIVDCRGKKSDARTWLYTLGYDGPPPEHFNPHIYYATQEFDYQGRPSPLFDDACSLLIAHSTPNRYTVSGAAFKIENGKALFTVAKRGEKLSVKDDQDFVQHFRAIEDLTLYTELTRPGAPVPNAPGAVHVYTCTPMTHQHYERWPRFPDNFVCLGDSVAHFNPAYGNGILSALQSTLALNRLLVERTQNGPLNLRGFGRNLMRRVSWRVLPFWYLSLLEDLREDCTEAPLRASPLLPVLHGATSLLLRAAFSEPHVHKTLLEFFAGSGSALQLVAPRALLGVLRTHLRLSKHPNSKSFNHISRAGTS